MIRVAVIYNERDIYIEWPFRLFVKVLEKYIKEYGSVQAAMNKIEQDIKAETRTS